MTDLGTPFGLKEGRIVAPSDVPAGAACACICIGCGAPLVAKKGRIKRWHFSHLNLEPTDSCTESAVHAAAKQVLVDTGHLIVPQVTFYLSAETNSGEILEERDVLSPTRRIRFDRAVAEVTEGDVRPDVVGYKKDRRLFVEMYFRHRVDTEKRGKLRKLGLPTLEIDLSDLDTSIGLSAIVERVIESSQYKEWLVYPGMDEHRAFLLQRLRDRVAAANKTYREAVALQKKLLYEQQRRQRIRQGREQRIQLGLSRCGLARQATWLRRKLGLGTDIPAFLCRQLPLQGNEAVDPFVWQASLFERFLYRRRVGSKVTQDAILKFLCMRFGEAAKEGQSRVAVVRYVDYLIRAAFLGIDYNDEAPGRYLLRHNDLYMPHDCDSELQFDAAPPLPAHAYEGGRRVYWLKKIPRWSFVLSEAKILLKDSPHQHVLQEGIDGLSAMDLPLSPHHWAAPLVAGGVPLAECLALLTELRLITAHDEKALASNRRR